MPRLILCLSPGRCGTLCLSRLLDTAEGVTASHEPSPTCASTVVTEEVHGEAAAALIASKVDAVAERVAAVACYAETTHMSMWWFDALMRSDVARRCRVDVVVLRRYLPAMVRSRMLLGHLDPESLIGPRARPRLRGLGWVHTLESASATVAAPGGPRTHAELVCGYLIDSEARIAALRREHGGAAIIDCSVESLNDEAGVRRLFEALELVPTVATFHEVGSNDGRHVRSPEKRADGPAYAIAACESAARAYVRRCHEAGIDLPPLPHMEPR